MSDEDRRYLISARKMRPSLKVFERMVQILKDVQGKTDELLHASLLKKVA